MKKKHPANELPFDKIEMPSEPLLDEHGNINPYCMTELEQAINNMPESYDRIAGNSEWSREAWVTDCEILGAFAGAATRCFCGAPPNLETVTNYIKACMRKDLFIEELADDSFRMKEMSLCGINKYLWGILENLPQFTDWNDPEKHENWIDLSACLHNTCLIIRDQRRHELAFDRKFEKEHGKFSGE